MSQIKGGSPILSNNPAFGVKTKETKPEQNSGKPSLFEAQPLKPETVQTIQDVQNKATLKSFGTFCCGIAMTATVTFAAISVKAIATLAVAAITIGTAHVTIPLVAVGLAVVGFGLVCAASREFYNNSVNEGLKQNNLTSNDLKEYESNKESYDSKLKFHQEIEKFKSNNDPNLKSELCRKIEEGMTKLDNSIENLETNEKNLVELKNSPSNSKHSAILEKIITEIQTQIESAKTSKPKLEETHNGLSQSLQSKSSDDIIKIANTLNNIDLNKGNKLIKIAQNIIKSPNDILNRVNDSIDIDDIDAMITLFYVAHVSVEVASSVADIDID